MSGVVNRSSPIATGARRRCVVSPFLGLTETDSCTGPVKPWIGVSRTVRFAVAPGVSLPDAFDTPIVKSGGGPLGGGGGGGVTPADEKAAAVLGVPRPVGPS